MKSLQDFLNESLRSDMRRISKWLDDDKNIKRFADAHDTGSELMLEVFAWIQASIEHVKSLDELIEFVRADGPTNFPDYAMDELNAEEFTVANINWSEVFNDIAAAMEAEK